MDENLVLLNCIPPRYKKLNIIHKYGHPYLECSEIDENTEKNHYIDCNKVFKDVIIYGRELYKLLKENALPFESELGRWYDDTFQQKTIFLRGPVHLNEKSKSIILSWIKEYGLPCERTSLYEKGDEQYQDPCIIPLYKLIDLLISSYIIWDYYDKGCGNFSKIFKKEDNSNVNIRIFNIIYSYCLHGKNPEIIFDYDGHFKMTIFFNSTYEIIIYALKLFICIRTEQLYSKTLSVDKYKICKICGCNFTNGKSNTCENCIDSRNRLKSNKSYQKKQELFKTIEELYKAKKEKITNLKTKQEINNLIKEKKACKRKLVSMKKLESIEKYLSELK